MISWRLLRQATLKKVSGMLLFLHVQSQVNNNNKSGPFIHFSIVLVSIKYNFPSKT